VRIRERRADDLPALEALLAAQQPASGYPHHWPLPFPVREFLVRRSEQRAWVAEDGDRLIGHVAVARSGADVDDAFAAALGTDRLGALTALFVATDVVGTGVGGRLIDAAVDWIRAANQVPVLDLLGRDTRAHRVYLRRGWVELGEAGPLVLMALVPHRETG
jgi:GNAT superfamily N-acetyltransferase